MKDDCYVSSFYFVPDEWTYIGYTKTILDTIELVQNDKLETYVPLSSIK